MKQIITPFCLGLLAITCNNNDEPGKDTRIAGTDSVKPVMDSSPAQQKDTVPQNIQIDSVIHLSFAPNKNSVTVEGHLDKKGNPVICLLPVVKGERLTASVTPENKKATIRFSHIYLPNGKSEGPFGSTLKYKLKLPSLYKIYVAPNKMAGDPASTDFTLNIKVD